MIGRPVHMDLPKSRVIRLLRKTEKLDDHRLIGADLGLAILQDLRIDAAPAGGKPQNADVARDGAHQQKDEHRRPEQRRDHPQHALDDIDEHGLTRRVPHPAGRRPRVRPGVRSCGSDPPGSGRTWHLLVEPDLREVVVQVVARRDRPPLHVGPVGDDAVPPQRDGAMGLLIHHPLLVGPHQPLLLGHIARPVHGVVQLDQLRILELAVLIAGVRPEPGDVDQRIDDRLAVELHRHVELALAQQREERAGGFHLLLDGDADLLPLVDQPDAQRRVGLVDGAVGQRELEVGDTGLLQQPPGFLARLVDVRPVARPASPAPPSASPADGRGRPPRPPP